MIDHKNKVIELGNDSARNMLIMVQDNKLIFQRFINRTPAEVQYYWPETMFAERVGDKATLQFDTYSDCRTFLQALSEIELGNTTELTYNSWTIRFMPDGSESFMGLQLMFRKVISAVLNKDFAEVINC